MAVRVPPERNFRRARLKPGRRSRFRLRVSWNVARRILCVILFMFGVYQTASLALTTPLLRVSQIAVRGNVRLSSGQVQALVEDMRGTSILRADLDAFRQRLIESPWVADVALRRILPSTIDVFITERRPVGLCRLGQDLYLVDETGTIIDQFGPQYAEFDLPIVDGLVTAPNTPAAMHGSIDSRRAGFAARVIAALGKDQEVGRRLSQVDVTDRHDAVVLLESDTALLHLGEDKFLERVRTYLDLSARLRERVADIDYVDLRFEPRVYVRPASVERAGVRPKPGARATRQF